MIWPFPQMNGISVKSMDILVHFSRKWEANTGLEQDNNLKTTYTASAAMMVDCISWATK